MKERIRIRRDTASNWSFYNPVLSTGEAGYETDSNKLKIGNGLTHWSGLPYLMGSEGGGTDILRIGDGTTETLSWSTSDRLDLVGGGNTSIFFDQVNNKIIFNTIDNNALTKSNITGVLGYLPQITGNYSNVGHIHNISDILGLQAGLDSKQVSGSYASDIHQHQISDVSGLISALNSKQASGVYVSGIHEHEIADISGLVAALNSKQASGVYASGIHQHQISDVSGLISALNSKLESNHRQPYSTIDNFCTGVAECVDTPLLAGSGILLSYVNGTGLYINSVGPYSTTGHSHSLYVGDGTNRVITYDSSENLNIKGSGNVSISFNDSNNTITIAGTGTSTSSSANGVGTPNYIAKWIDTTGISNSNIYESENKIGINTTNPLADFHTVGSGIINTGIFSEIILTKGTPFNTPNPAKIKFNNGIELSVLNDSVQFTGFDPYSELLTINKSGISTPNVDNSQIHGGYF